MQCFRPLRGHWVTSQSKFGEVRQLRWDAPLGSADGITVACGTCIGCRLDRSRDWTVRMLHEQQLHPASCFVTLTYRPEDVPSDRSLHVEDWQAFKRRLDRRIGKTRFFMCGEYGDAVLDSGDQQGLPHWHAILFGYDFRKDRKFHKHNKHGDALYTSALLEDVWGKGWAPIGDATPQSIRYVASYVNKKQTGERSDAVYGRRRPPFCTMSRRPGIGADWFARYGKRTMAQDECVLDGKPVPVPRYYDRLFKESDPEEFERLVDARMAAKRAAGEHDQPERLKTREGIVRRSLERFSRDLKERKR